MPQQEDEGLKAVVENFFEEIDREVAVRVDLKKRQLEKENAFRQEPVHSQDKGSVSEPHPSNTLKQSRRYMNQDSSKSTEMEKEAGSSPSKGSGLDENQEKQ